MWLKFRNHTDRRESSERVMVIADRDRGSRIHEWDNGVPRLSSLKTSKFPIPIVPRRSVASSLHRTQTLDQSTSRSVESGVACGTAILDLEF